MLTIPQIYLVLLLCSRIEAEVGLIREVVREEDKFDKGGLRDKRLRLFYFPAEESRLLPVGHVRLLVPVDYL